MNTKILHRLGLITAFLKFWIVIGSRRCDNGFICSIFLAAAMVFTPAAMVFTPAFAADTNCENDEANYLSGAMTRYCDPTYFDQMFLISEILKFKMVGPKYAEYVNIRGLLRTDNYADDKYFPHNMVFNVQTAQALADRQKISLEKMLASYGPNDGSVGSFTHAWRTYSGQRSFSSEEKKHLIELAAKVLWTHEPARSTSDYLNGLPAGAAGTKKITSILADEANIKNSIACFVMIDRPSLSVESITESALYENCTQRVNLK